MDALRPLVIKSTAGVERLEACAQALTVAATATAAGARVSLWLTGEATWLAVPGRAATVELPNSAPLDELLDVVLSAGTLTVCTQCAVRRDLTESELLPGVRIAGAATFVEETLAPDVQALVY